jgi:hypothetical protein
VGGLDLKRDRMGDMDWINLPQDWEQWNVLVNTVMRVGDFSKKVQLHEVS